MPIKVLIIGNTSDDHLKRFAKYMDDLNKEKKVIIEAFNRNELQKNDLFNKTYHIRNYFPKFFFKFSSTLNALLNRINYLLSFSRVGKYDLINIHFLTFHSYILLPLYKRKSKKIMISPWGSDVYRIPTNDLKEKARKIYKTVDYVSAPKIKFREDIQEVFSVPDYKIIDLAFGSENIDTLIDNESLSKVTAKKELSTENSFVITCGYNKHKAHNHLKIIHALISVKETLPVNTVLFFPMTYGPSDDEYLNEIETKLKENHFTYTIFNQYLSSRDIMVMQKATDLFICIQDTDANSATLQEYLLSGTNIILGQWLRYPQFEEYGIPYWTTPSKDSLKNTLNEYFISPTKISVPKELKEQIKNNAWSVKIKDWYNFYLSL